MTRRVLISARPYPAHTAPPIQLRHSIRNAPAASLLSCLTGDNSAGAMWRRALVPAASRLVSTHSFIVKYYVERHTSGHVERESFIPNNLPGGGK